MAPSLRLLSVFTSSFSLCCSTMSQRAITLLSQQQAIDIDQSLFNEYRFSVDQLMEIAGLSCALSAARAYPDKHRPLVLVGPGNNGGDGFVCARHLSLFGYKPTVYYPKESKNDLMQALKHQVSSMDIPITTSPDELNTQDADFVIDAFFGFSFKPPVREPYTAALSAVVESTLPVMSVDIPSGWNVETGPPTSAPILQPDVLISLTAPKLCAQHFKGRRHFVGGRFVPPSLAQRYNLVLPQYEGTEEIVDVTQMKLEEEKKVEL